MAAMQLALRFLLAMIVAASATRGLRAREGSSVESFAQTGRTSTQQHASKRFGTMQDDDGEEDEEQGNGEDEPQEDEVQEVRQDVQRGPPMDATSLMLQSSNELLASARAAAEAPGAAASFAQTDRTVAKTETGHKALRMIRRMKDTSGAAESLAQTGRRLKRTAAKKVGRMEEDDDEYENGYSDQDMEPSYLDEDEDVFGSGGAAPEEAAEDAGDFDSETTLDSADSFAQLRRATKRASAREADDDDDGQDGAEDAPEDQVQEVRQDAPRGPATDATSMILQGSNALLASARAAAQGT